jgi:hypothetical protein
MTLTRRELFHASHLVARGSPPGSPLAATRLGGGDAARFLPKPKPLSLSQIGSPSQTALPTRQSEVRRGPLRPRTQRPSCSLQPYRRAPCHPRRVHPATPCACTLPPCACTLPATPRAPGAARGQPGRASLFRAARPAAAAGRCGAPAAGAGAGRAAGRRGDVTQVSPNPHPKPKPNPNPKPRPCPCPFPSPQS